MTKRRWPRVPPFRTATKCEQTLRMTALAMEDYIQELIKAAWDPLGYTIEIWRQNGHVRTNLIAGLPPEEWSAITGREPPPPRHREET